MGSPPTITEIDDGARFLHCLKGLQHVVKNAAVLRDRKRLTEWMAKRPAKTQCPWRTHLDGDVSHQTDRHRRYAGGFNRSLNQSHGLITQSSSGKEQRDINLVLDQELRRSGSCLLP
jgi:hypothetical protein